MKKITAFALSVLFALSLTACSRRDMDKTESAIDNAGNSVADKVDDAADKTESAIDDTADKAEQSTQLVAEITAEQALEKALDHAKLKKSDVTDIDIDLDRDNGTLIYEVDFNHGGTEYDYDIDAKSGEIISADRDRD